MGDTEFNRKLDERLTKVSKLHQANRHPLVQVVVTVCALAGTLGGGGAFFQYLGDKDAAKTEAQNLSDKALRERLELEMEVTDLRAQVAASVLLIAAQGTQLKQLHDAFTKLTTGQRRSAAAILETIDIPMAQGQPILAGRAMPPPSSYDAKKRVIRALLDDLESEPPE